MRYMYQAVPESDPEAMTAQQLHSFLAFHWSSLEPTTLFTVEKCEAKPGPSPFNWRPPQYFVRLYAVLPDDDILISEEDFLTETGARDRFEKKVEKHYTPDQESTISAREIL